MREAAMFAVRLVDSRNLLTWMLLLALALMTGFNLVQAHVIEVQRAEVRNSIATDFFYLHLLSREREAAAAAGQNKKAEPVAPPQSR